MWQIQGIWRPNSGPSLAAEDPETWEDPPPTPTASQLRESAFPECHVPPNIQRFLGALRRWKQTTWRSPEPLLCVPRPPAEFNPQLRKRGKRQRTGLNFGPHKRRAELQPPPPLEALNTANRDLASVR